MSMTTREKRHQYGRKRQHDDRQHFESAQHHKPDQGEPASTMGAFFRRSGRSFGRLKFTKSFCCEQSLFIRSTGPSTRSVSPKASFTSSNRSRRFVPLPVHRQDQHPVNLPEIQLLQAPPHESRLRPENPFHQHCRLRANPDQDRAPHPNPVSRHSTRLLQLHEPGNMSS